MNRRGQKRRRIERVVLVHRADGHRQRLFAAKAGDADFGDAGGGDQRQRRRRVTYLRRLAHKSVDDLPALAGRRICPDRQRRGVLVEAGVRIDRAMVFKRNAIDHRDRQRHRRRRQRRGDGNKQIVRQIFVGPPRRKRLGQAQFAAFFAQLVYADKFGPVGAD